jgi:single-strand DNA-binding protein
MASFNKVILIGNMVSDPECKSTPNGISVCRFRVAVQRKFAKEGQQTADFLDVVSWKSAAEFVSKYFKKGNPILVCGQIQSRTWEDKDGAKRYAVEILADEVSFVASKENNDSNDTSYMSGAYSQNTAKFEEVSADENLPF